jgi:hypothetical protein
MCFHSVCFQVFLWRAINITHLAGFDQTPQGNDKMKTVNVQDLPMASALHL